MRKLLLVCAMTTMWAGATRAGDRAAGSPAAKAAPSTAIHSLDGSDWLLATDPGNAGKKDRWFQSPRPAAKKTRVPWIIQDAFPGYHGVAWYWKRFTPPANPHAQARAGACCGSGPSTTWPRCGSTACPSAATRGAKASSCSM